MASEGKIPAVKIEFGKDDRVIIRVPYLIPLQKELSIRKYSMRTIELYTRINRDSLLVAGQKPEEVENEDIKKFFYYMSKIKRLRKKRE